jgi:hypothetical protein
MKKIFSGFFLIPALLVAALASWESPAGEPLDNRRAELRKEPVEAPGSRTTQPAAYAARLTEPTFHGR